MCQVERLQTLLQAALRKPVVRMPAPNSWFVFNDASVRRVDDWANVIQ